MWVRAKILPMIRNLTNLILSAILLISCGKPGKDRFISDDGRIIREVSFEVLYDSRSSQLSMKHDRASGVAFVRHMDGDLYAYDIKANQVIRFDSLGYISKRYGRGQGRGPGEFAQMSRFDVSETMIVVADPVLKRLTYFDIDDGSVISTKPLKYHPLGIAFLRNGRDAAILHTMRDSLVYLYPYDSLSYTSAWKIDGYDTGGDYLMSMNGDILAMGDSIVYYPNQDHRNYTILLNSAGALRPGIVSASVDTFTFRPSIKTGADMGYRILSPDFEAFRRTSGRAGIYEYFNCRYFDVDKFDERIVRRFYLDRYHIGGSYVDSIDLTNTSLLDNVNDIREVWVVEGYVVLNILYNDIIIIKYEDELV
jgi:hypothetical protein